jgi:hypothetical protein
MWTLTYAGEGCHDQDAMRADVAQFWRDLRTLRGGKRFAYVWVPEWHPGGHGLHVHTAVGQYIHKSVIRTAWPHGWVKGNRFTTLRHGATDLEAARAAAGYLGKYLSKTFEDGQGFGRHRYEVGQGFQPKRIVYDGGSVEEVLWTACQHMNSAPAVSWSSQDTDDWQGPPTRWFQWT